MNTETITIEVEPVKPCRVCGARERNKYGKCKPCVKLNKRKWDAANKDNARKRSSKYREGNLDKCRKRCQNWRENNKVKTREWAKRYRKENPTKVMEAKRKFRQVNAHKEREYGRQWRATNADKVRANTQNRRALIKGSGGILSRDIVQRLFRQQNGKCACCGADLKETGHHLDHVMPLALGGSNTDDNVQLLTPVCNLRKGAKHPDKWKG